MINYYLNVFNEGSFIMCFNLMVFLKQKNRFPKTVNIWDINDNYNNLFNKLNEANLDFFLICITGDINYIKLKLYFEENNFPFMIFF